jgi:small subunit ribosomal protein S16
VSSAANKDFKQAYHRNTTLAVRIRLTRAGRKKVPCFRIVVMDGRKRRDGAYLDQLGVYYPAQQPAVVGLSNQKALDWLSKGAQPSETVRSLFSREGIMIQFDLLKRGASGEQAAAEATRVKTAATTRAQLKLASAADRRKAKAEEVAKAAEAARAADAAAKAAEAAAARAAEAAAAAEAAEAASAAETPSE